MTAAIISVVSFVVVAFLAGALRGVGKKVVEDLWSRKVGKD